MAQGNILKYFSNRKNVASEDAFIHELHKINKDCEKNQNKSEIPSLSANCCEHIDEIEKMKQVEINLRNDVTLFENKAKVFEVENKNTKEKYEKLELKHIQLLQMLLEKEKLIQNLMKKVRRMDTDDRMADVHQISTPNFEQVI